nr:type IV secretory system conjugative DNA transfer family protein [Desulfosporosinus metallidurans]
MPVQISQVVMLIIIAAIMFGVIGFIILLANYYTLNGIKSKTVGDGQHGTARFVTKHEILKTYAHVPYEPERWRKGENLPIVQGLIVGCKMVRGFITALVDQGDVHALMIGAAGVGKTANFLYPNLEYACASGMSFMTTDTKGDLYRNYGSIAKDYYGYDVSVIDLRNPTRSDGNNMLHLVNKYMDQYRANPDSLAAKAKAEKYAKITAKTIINSGGLDAGSYGQNAFFYDAAEGLLTAVILLIAEYCPKEKRHIISVFKMIQDLLAPSGVKGKNQFQLLIEKLHPEHKARWFAGAALNTAEQAMQSVLSTALSRLNAFLDSELEQILCFDTAIDAEKFCNTKSAIFLVMPEEDSTKYFLISLIVQQLYREILSVADETGGKLKNRVMMYLDEIGTIPKIDSAEMMFSASRSRRVSIVAIIQSFAQLEKNYGKEGSAIIIDNCQDTIFGGFAPNSESAEILSKSLGNKTVMSGSVSRGKNDPSQSLQMIQRPLMTSDELKTLPKGNFIVTKTGSYPMRTILKLFLEWGIKFEKVYTIEEKSARKVAYADRRELEEEIIKRHACEEVEDETEPSTVSAQGGMSHVPTVPKPHQEPPLRTD